MASRALEEDKLESVDLVLGMLELLSGSPQPRSLGDIARALDISKPRAHRHLRALLLRDYVRQDEDTDRYEITARLLGLGEAVRSRISFAGTARPAMTRLRDATGQAVTASTMVAGKVTIVELLHGRTLVEFAIRPGTVMDPLLSAHGLVALAFGPSEQILAEAGLSGAPEAELAQVYGQGWATAPGRIVTGVNALAAPAFGYDGTWAGTVAIVGSVDTIAAEPDAYLIDAVRTAAADISGRLGWRG
ncbi:IclR family transcriptional regulator [Flavisphingomonas formosensis]|uniref:IclR family transcriptional regulator n=1 Tax=Flavisphingomonas formosensis TaxID=861534 RepID=UPI0012F739D9|nr:IclR family transcriptional regulator [Sphingomonas formosensis]